MNDSQLILNELISILKQMLDNDWLNEEYNLKNGTTTNVLRMIDTLHYQLPMYDGYGLMSEFSDLLKTEISRTLLLEK